MATIDQKVVEMAFRGASFISGVKTALSALTSLKNGLNSLKGGSKDLDDLNAAGKKVNFKGLSDGIDEATHHLDLMKIAGLTIFTTLVHQAFLTGEQILKGLTIDPIKAGLDVYETKINAIQTILANTAAAGTNLNQVTDALNQLNTYANQTVFNFGEMAKNIGTFTAAGVGLKDSVASIKGIANLAALSGSSAEQASTAMYQLSQAIANGSLKLEDWNSVVNAGIGGKVFQKALIDTARTHGIAVDAMIKKDGSFRNSLQEGWITSSVLTDTLAQFTGDLSVAQLKAMGFTNQEAEAIFKQGQAAVGAATHIKTITQLMQALKEEVATAWSQVFEAIFGNITQATSTFTALHNVAENALTTPIKNLAKLITTFSELGGRAIVIDTIKQAFQDLTLVLHTIGQAFDAVFGGGSGGAGVASHLVVIAGAVLTLTERLKPSKQALSDIKIVFEGLFSVVKIGVDIITAIISAIFKVGSTAGGAGGGFLALAAKIASFVIAIKDSIESGNILVKFFQLLATIISLPIKAIGAIIGALGGIGGAATGAASGISSFIDKVGQEFAKLGDAIVNGIKSGDLSKIGTILNQILLGGVLVQIRKFIKGLGSGGGSGGGLFSTIKESFENLTGALQAMQQNLKSGTLLKIAAAVALLTASLVALSFINVGDLTKSLTAITVLFTEMLTALAVVSKISGTAGIVKMPAIAVALNLLATAILILTAAVAILAQFSWEELAKGLGAIAILLTELAVATQLMAANTKGLVASAASMVVMAIALNLMALAVKQLGSLDFGTLAKGIGSIAALLLLLTAFTNFSGDTLISTAASLLLIGAALVVISTAVAKLGGLSLATLAKGIAGIAAVLLILIIAMAAMEGALPGAAALIIASTALVILSKALNSLGSESWAEIGKALVLLAGSLVIIAAAMILMTEALPGAAALLVVAAALAILTPVLVTLGGLSWESIAKGLLALAGVFLVIGAAGLLLAPLVPVLLGIGLAITLLGVGVLAAGAGVAILAVGLTALAAAIAVSGVAILTFVKSILSLIPTAFAAIGAGIVSFAKAISDGTVAITNAFVAIMTAVLNAIIKVVPTAVKAFGAIIGGFLTAITQNAPKVLAAISSLILSVLNNFAKNAGKFVTAGVNIIVNTLNGITKNIPRIATAGTNTIIAFINAIGASIQKVVTAGINMVIRLVNGIANQIRTSTPAMRAAANNLASAIINALVQTVLGGLSSVVSAIVNVAKSALDAAKHFLGINSPSKKFMEVGDGVMEGWALGHTRSAHLVTDSLTTVGQAAIDTLTKTMSGIGKAVDANIDLQPRITPIVDLSQAKKGFNELGGLSKDQLINAGVSSTSAASISAANAALAQQAGLIGVTGGAPINFIQNNTSPVALDAATIYRRTNNQISRAKGALAGANAS